MEIGREQSALPCGAVEASIKPALPAPPEPSADSGIKPDTYSTKDHGSFLRLPDEIDIFTLSPMAALRMLCGSMEALIQSVGDITSTHPMSQPSISNLRTIRAEKDNVIRHNTSDTDSSSRVHGAFVRSEDIDNLSIKKTPIGSPESGVPEPHHIIGTKFEPLNVQHVAVTRKFFSKKPPPISLEEYLLRLHCFCPMSTAVYLATNLYIYRLAVVERIIPVTDRNAHRLILAGLRVAMKALEDISYPHRRFSKVGGVTESELGRLEVSFCFLTNFELRVDAEMLLRQVRVIKEEQLSSSQLLAKTGSNLEF